MSKVIFFNFPAHGCINALLATIKELVKRGENIIYYCSEEFKDTIEKTGTEFRPYDDVLNELNMVRFNLFRLVRINIEMTVAKMAWLPVLVRP